MTRAAPRLTVLAMTHVASMMVEEMRRQFQVDEGIL